MSDKAIATSAPLGTTLDDKATIGHIIDPRDATVPNLWKRISVVHNSATIADGLSTAFVVMRRDEIIGAIKHYSGTKLIAIDRDDQRFTV